MKHLLKFLLMFGLAFNIFWANEASAILGFDPYPNPKNIDQLRKHENWKIRRNYKAGNFIFALDAGDGEPILLISSKLSVEVKPKYFRMLDYNNDIQYCWGTYTYDKFDKRNKAWILKIEKCRRGNNLIRTERDQNEMILPIQEHIHKVTKGSINIIRVSFREFPPRYPFNNGIDDLVEHQLSFMKRYSVNPYNGDVENEIRGEERFSIVAVDVNNKLQTVGLKDDAKYRGARQLVLDSSGDQIYFLPWKPTYIIKTQIAAQSSIFFTAALSGCSIFVTGPPHNPTVYHAGLELSDKYEGNDVRIKIAFKKDTILFFRVLLEIKDRNSRRDKYFAEVNKYDYMKPGGYPTKRLETYIAYIRDLHRFDGLVIKNYNPWGAVFGFRNHGKWKFYIQENVTIQYDFNRPKQPKIEVKKAKNKKLTKKKVTSKKPAISVPIAIRQFYPNNANKKKNLIDIWQRLRISYD